MLFVVAAIVLHGAGAWARPGGGGSFSGGGGGSSGGGDIFDYIEMFIDVLQLLYWVLELSAEYPQFALPIFGGLIAIVVFYSLATAAKKAWSSSGGERAAKALRPARSVGDASLAAAPIVDRHPSGVAVESPVAASYQALRSLDPDFSPIVFEDFVYALYAEAHAARDPKRLAELAAYLAPSVRSALDGIHQGATSVGEVVIGSMRLGPVHLDERGDGDGNRQRWATVSANFETNYTERGQGVEGGAQSFLAVERWTLRRKASARSRTPETARVLHCPGCGAPLDGMRGSTCSYCRQQVDTGAFDWVVFELAPERKEPRVSMLTGDVEERGTDEPTRFDPERDARLADLGARDPAFALTAFSARVELIFNELQVAWSTRDWTRARPFVSDSLFQMELGYIEAYQRERLRNVTEGARITERGVVKVQTDRHYDAVTIRLWATSLDYTVTDDGKLVAGSRSRPRSYSEYWTLIRGVDAKGAARVDRSCPNCGAPLQINMAGNCEHCRARVGCGAFDWVLSRIEQDEVYQG